MEATPEIAKVKPRLRGVSHEYAFFVSLVSGGLLAVLAPAGEATLAATVYAVSVSALFGTSALYHRITWSPEARRWMRRLDHCMIFVLIAGTYTPFALLVMRGSLATVILAIVWGGTLAGLVLNLIWVDAPKPVVAAAYLTMGWVAVAALPQILDHAGGGALALLAGGGLLYTAGALIYARRRPDPLPEVFGYHEIFHVLVIVAAALHYAAVAAYAIPAG
jgi:hemolysin III